MDIGKRMTAILMMVALVLPLPACGKKKDGKKTKKETEIRTVVSESDPYFTITEKEVPIPIDEEKEIDDMFLGECSFLSDSVIVSYEIRYKTDPEEELEMMDQIRNGQDEGFQEWYDKYNVRGKMLLDLDGNLLMDLASFDKEDCRIFNIIENKDGEKYAVVYTFQEGSYFLRKISKDGTMDAGMELPVEAGEGSDVFFLPDGNLMISTWGTVSLIASDGTLIGTAENNEFLGQVYFQDGKTYGGFDHYDQNDWDQSYQYWQEIDTRTGAFSGEKIKCTRANFIIRGQDGNYLQDSNGITKVDLLDPEKNREVFNWNDTDYDHRDISDALVKSDADIYFLSCREEPIGDSLSEEQRAILHLNIAHAVREEKNPHAGKKILRAGVLETEDPYIGESVLRYNLKKDASCRIELIYYSLQDENVSSGALGLPKGLADRVALDLRSGNGPDILIGFSGLLRFNTGEVLADLNPFIDATDGTGLDRNAYFDNLFRASESGGKLYQIPVSFTVSGYAANRDLVGDKTSYTYQEFLDAAKTLPLDATVFQEIPYDELLASLGILDFVDQEKKQVYFDDPAFLKLLEIVKTYGSSRTHEEIVLEMQEDPDARPDQGLLFLEDHLAFADVSFSSLPMYAAVREKLGVKAVFCGTPDKTGGTMVAEVQKSLAISAVSKNQKEAWDFLRFILSEEEQTLCADPVRGEGMPVSRKAMDHQNAEFPELSEKQVTEELLSIVESIRKVESSDPEVLEVILEEAPGYFTDQRTAEEVAKTIQNRTKTILQER